MTASNDTASTLCFPDLPPVHTLAADELQRVARDDVQRMAAGTLLATVVRGFLSATLVARVLEAIDAPSSGFPETRPPVLRGVVYGRPLVAAGDVLDGYLDDASRFSDACARIFGTRPSLEARLAAALGSLSTRPTRLARDEGRDYGCATIRHLVEGDRIPMHYENETLDRPVMRRLRPRLDDAALLSFVVSIAGASQGGELRIYPGHHDTLGDHFIPRSGGDEGARRVLDRGSVTIDLAAGDLVVFDGGRYYHEVTQVHGARITLGGFMAPTRDGSEVLFWG